MDRTCPVENCSLINRAMKLLYTSPLYVYIYVKSRWKRQIYFYSSFPFLFHPSFIKNPNYIFLKNFFADIIRNIFYTVSCVTSK